MKIQSENIAFNVDDLIECTKCGKSNPPNRSSCLYCAAELEIPEDRTGGLKLNFRPLENWENGFNVVFIPPAERPDLAGIARYLKYEPEQAGEMLEARAPFPAARLESERDAAAAAKHLGTLGLNARVITDVDLKVGKPNARLRSVIFEGDTLRLTDFNTGRQSVLKSDDLVLIVPGRIVDSKTEAVAKRKKSERKVLSESATDSDDQLVDLYATGEEAGFRISTRGFDFSSLGSEKRMLAAQNIELMREKIRIFAPAAKLIEDYDPMSAALSLVWDIDRRTDFEGLKRLGVWKSGYSSVVRTTNLEQFTKYSRLQRLLL